MKKMLFVVLALCLLTACGETVDNTLIPTATINPTRPPVDVTPTTASSISPEASAYLDDALDIMQEHSINRYQIDWAVLRQKAHARARDAQTLADTYDAIRFALGELGDNHSGFMSPDQTREFQEGGPRAETPEPRGELLDRGLGYVVLPGYSGAGEAAPEYVTTVQQIIREIDAANPCGWIVDLRENTGGNMWPMLAGIGPVLGEGQVGMFIYPDGQQSFWDYADGQARLDGRPLTQAAETYRLQREMPPVAVLTGRDTRSSGEAVVVAFRGRENTRSFGEATGGLSTANQMYDLSDGARINLTVSVFADRTGYPYGDQIAPDQVGQPALDMAIEWLLDQPSCAVSIEQMPGGYEGWIDYAHAKYGFSFRYPPDWTLEEPQDPVHTMKDHLIWLKSSQAVLAIGFKHLDEDVLITRTGVGAGDLVTRGTVIFLGEPVSRDVLVLEGRDMAVLYNSAGETQRNDLVFTLSLDYVGESSATTLQKDVQAVADMIVTSFELSE